MYLGADNWRIGTGQMDPNYLRVHGSLLATNGPMTETNVRLRHLARTVHTTLHESSAAQTASNPWRSRKSHRRSLRLGLQSA
jgi:hypothetical protein